MWMIYPNQADNLQGSHCVNSEALAAYDLLLLLAYICASSMHLCASSTIGASGMHIGASGMHFGASDMHIDASGMHICASACILD